MKKNQHFLIGLFAIIMTLSACSTTVNWDEERDNFDREDGLLMYNEKPFTGKVERFYDVHYKKIKESQEFKNGLPNGENTEYFKKGGIRSTVNYIDGKMEGDRIVYKSEGVVSLKETYKGGKLNGEKLNYYNNDTKQVYEKTNYKDGKMDGEKTTFFESGKVQTNCFFKAGEIDGAFVRYNEDGTEIEKKIYKMGTLQAEN